MLASCSVVRMEQRFFSVNEFYSICSKENEELIIVVSISRLLIFDETNE